MIIFAKYGTDEKVLLSCDPKHRRDVQLFLNKKYGGEWIWVETLNPNEEMLKFNDGLIYRGFHARDDERYCNGIKNLFNLKQTSYDTES